MRLKEKFNATVPIEFGGMYEPLLKDCVLIADEFAIGFAEWLILKCDYQRHGVFEYLGEEYTNKELLEIHKKEKGL